MRNDPALAPLAVVTPPITLGNYRRLHESPYSTVALTKISAQAPRFGRGWDLGRVPNRTSMMMDMLVFDDA